MSKEAAARGEDFMVTAQGRRLAARRIAAPRGDGAETLVFLHEGLGSIAQWRDFPAALCQATGRAGLLYDRWGFGGSEPLELPRPTDYLQIEARTFLPEVLAACGVEQPILIGHSDGGSIALLYAAAFPEKVAACITEAAHVFVEEVTLAGIRQAAEAWETTDLRHRLARYHGDKTERVFRGWTETWLSEPFRHWNIVAELPRIRCPLLIMQGEDDEYGTAAQVTAIAEGVSGPAQTRLLPGCAHVPHHQASDEVLAVMTAFIQSLRS